MRAGLPACLAALAALGCGGARPVRDPGPLGAVATPAWESWSPAAFARARHENKLLLIDVSAGWCHWCHVMDAETYADPTVVRILAASYVAIRVDADARPDLAERYQRWGWPATAILTPDAQPVLERKGFQPARTFATLLARLAAEHAAGRRLARVAEPPATPAAPAELGRILASTRAQLDAFYDTAMEGWGGPQKYPYAAPIEHAFLRAALRGETLWRRRALATLDREARLVDPVWGGMFQYSVGGTWDEPHTEKIVAIQAGAIENAALAARVTGEPRWLAMADGLRRYLRRFLRGADGAYGSSQDADVAGRMHGPAFYALDDAARRRVGIPRVDDRVHADSNGLVIRALSALYAAGGGSDVLAEAIGAAERIERTHRLGPGLYTHAAAEPGAAVYLADEVEMGRALLALHEATGEARYLERATLVAEALLATFRVGGRGGLVESTADPRAVGVFAARRAPLLANAGGARFLLALARVTRQERYRQAATEVLVAVATPGEIRRRGRTVGELVLALEELGLRAVHVTVVGRPAEPAARALHREALRLADPRRVVAWGEPGALYPDLGRPAAYLCDDRSCSSPITDPALFTAQAARFLETL